MEANAVFSGGGVKGIAFVGAIKVCEERGYRWRRLAGTSSGAIIASLLAAGYNADELRKLMATLDYRKVIKSKKWGIIPFHRQIRILFKLGMYSGDYLIKWIDNALKQKKVSTFADLPSEKLTIIASNLSTGQILQLPKDAPLINLDPDRLKISYAIRMSISIPFFFDPIIIKTKKPQYIVDGGVLSNFPVWIFDDDLPDKYPTFGFNLRAKDPQHFHQINGPFSMLHAIIATMLESQDMKYIEKQDAVRTIFIPTPGVKSTEFTISNKQQQSLYESGQEAARKFFCHWNFENYIRVYLSQSKTAVPVNSMNKNTK